MNHNSTLQTPVRQLLLLSCFLAFHLCVTGQILPGNTDDFQDLSTSGWSEGAPSPNPPFVLPNGGPAGDGDAFLRNFSAGGSGAGSKWAMFNTSDKWTGNYLDADVQSITMDARNMGPANVHFRIAFDGMGGPIASVKSFTFSPDSTWHSIIFDLSPQSFIAVETGGNPMLTLASVSEFRILSSVIPSHQGDAVPLFADVDNIRALQTSHTYRERLAPIEYQWDHSTRTLSLNDHEIYPVEFRLFNIMGQMLMYQRMMTSGAIHIPSHAPGLYFAVLSDHTVIRLML